MIKQCLYITFAVMLFLALACDEDNSLSSSDIDYAPGTSLLGLTDGRILEYLQTDSVVSFDPVYSVAVTASALSIIIRQAGKEWIILADSSPIINLRVTDNAVIQNGYWQEIDGSDSLFYVAIPPVNMRIELGADSHWDGFTPVLSTATGDRMVSVYIAHFGFFFTKQFEGIVPVVVPAGSFDAYQFTVDLFVNPLDSIPVASISEFYAPGVGLVQQNFRGGALNRSLSLITYD